MTLAAGKTLAHYEITSLLGKGGMGEVYRAKDKKLRRNVALKLLPADLSDDPERLGRLVKEARALAALDHPVDGPEVWAALAGLAGADHGPDPEGWKGQFGK